MKTLDVELATDPLSTYVRQLVDGEILVLMANDEPVAAIVSLKDVDQESLALSTNPEFLEIIERAREEFESGKTLSLDEMKAEVASMH